MTILPTMPEWAFGSMVVGLLWLWLWTTRARLLGVVPIAAGALAALMAPRPDILVTGDGRHLAIVDEQGTPYLLRDRAGDFVRDTMGESAGFDGDAPPLEVAPGTNCSRDACVVEVRRAGRRWTLLATRSGQTLDWKDLVDACAGADIVISERRLPRKCSPRWLKLDRVALKHTGGLSIRLDSEPVVDTVNSRIAGHPWRQ